MCGQYFIPYCTFQEAPFGATVLNRVPLSTLYALLILQALLRRRATPSPALHSKQEVALELLQHRRLRRLVAASRPSPAVGAAAVLERSAAPRHRKRRRLEARSAAAVVCSAALAAPGRREGARRREAPPTCGSHESSWQAVVMAGRVLISRVGYCPEKCCQWPYMQVAACKFQYMTLGAWKVLAPRRRLHAGCIFA